jgi:hypothetical protein
MDKRSFVVWARIDKEFVVEAPDAEMAKRYVKQFADGTIRRLTRSALSNPDLSWSADCSAVVDDRADSLDLQIKVDNGVNTWDELYG